MSVHHVFHQDVDELLSRAIRQALSFAVLFADIVAPCFVTKSIVNHLQHKSRVRKPLLVKKNKLKKKGINDQ